jgi:hypothetical protein
MVSCIHEAEGRDRSIGNSFYIVAGLFHFNQYCEDTSVFRYSCSYSKHRSLNSHGPLQNEETIVKHFVCDLREIQDTMFGVGGLYFPNIFAIFPSGSCDVTWSLRDLLDGNQTISLLGKFVCVGSSIALNFPSSSFGGICGFILCKNPTSNIIVLLGHRCDSDILRGFILKFNLQIIEIKNCLSRNIVKTFVGTDLACLLRQTEICVFCFGNFWSWGDLGKLTMDPSWSENKRILRRHEDIFEGSRVQIREFSAKVNNLEHMVNALFHQMDLLEHKRQRTIVLEQTVAMLLQRLDSLE